MQDIRKIVGSKIKAHRKLLNMTQYELAEKVGVDPKYISRIETGTSYPSLSVVEKIFEILSIDICNLSQEKITYNKEDMISAISKNLQKTSVSNIKIVKEIVDLIVSNSD